MRKIIDFTIYGLKPEKKDVFKSQGIETFENPSNKITELFDSAQEIFEKNADPKGIISEVTIPEFADVYSGNGKYEAETPLQHIFPKAGFLALFAFTIGKRISRKIEELFEQSEFPLGSMLDSVASCSADRAAHKAERYFFKYLLETKQSDNSSDVLLYSPGYCGWHISGQKKLFEYLKPEDIGISLNSSFLMIPLKSISGVLICGHKRIHTFKNTYSFCTQCQDHSCKQRINRLDKKDTED